MNQWLFWTRCESWREVECLGLIIALCVLNSVLPFAWDYAPYAPGWVANIALVAGDDMQMKMQNRLAGSQASVEANVVAVWLKTLLDFCFDYVDFSDEFLLFFLRSFEPVCDMASWNYEGVP